MKLFNEEKIVPIILRQLFEDRNTIAFFAFLRKICKKFYEKAE